LSLSFQPESHDEFVQLETFAPELPQPEERGPFR
jgi:hypothetical protein